MNPNKKKALKLFQQCVTERYPACLRCGAGPVTAHHVFSRRNETTAFNPESGLSLCADCHDGWTRLYPDEVRVMLRDLIGQERYIYLAALSEEIAHYRDADYRDIVVRLEKELADLRAGV
jgi:ribosomal protein S27AE